MTSGGSRTPLGRHTDEDGETFLTGVEALARLPIAQLRADRVRGYNTAAFLSGYQRPPLGDFDRELTRAVEDVPDLPILLRPAVNEELGATAVMGSQLVSIRTDAKYEGVVGFWYGSSSGLDRAAAAIRHANHVGASRYGGAVALVGDDPGAIGSALPSSSEPTLIDLKTPVLHPGDVQEVLDLGRHAVTLSRLTGLWTAMKIVDTVADGWGSASLELDAVTPIEPNLEVDGLLHVPVIDGRQTTSRATEREDEIQSVRLEIARRYGVVNDLNRPSANPRRGWIGIVAAGHVYHEVVEALRRMGLRTASEVDALGIRLLRLQMPFPLDRRVVRNFARGLEEVVVVEERTTTVECMVKDVLYGGAVRPRVVGRVDDQDRQLVPAVGLLTADELGPVLYRRLVDRIGHRLTPPPPDRDLPVLATRPERPAGEAIGITSRGAEGSQWVGMEPFVEDDHVSQSLDDLTLYHSGQLAIQGAIAAGSNVTYRLRYTETGEPTGSGSGVGILEIKDLVKVLLAMGVTEVLVVTDDPDRHEYDGLGTSRHAGRTKVWDRRRVVEAEEYLATVPGVSVLVSDQPSLAESGRKGGRRGRSDPAPSKLVIDHRICRAYGGCGEVGDGHPVPADTPVGTATNVQPDPRPQNSFCREGDCPGLVAVKPGAGRDPNIPTKGPDPATIAERLKPLIGRLGEPVPQLPGGSADDGVDLRLAGVGGLAAARVLGTAAVLDGWTVRGFTQAGTSPGVGPVVSDLRLTKGEPAPSNLIGRGQAQVIIGFDPVVVGSDAVVRSGRHGRTVVVASTTPTSPTSDAELIAGPGPTRLTEAELGERLAAVTGTDRNRFVNAGDLTRRVLGEGGRADLFLLGVAHQSGLLPVGSDAIEEAIECNGVAVEAQRNAFRFGRCWARGIDGTGGAAELDRLWLGQQADNGGHGGESDGEARLPEWLSKQLLDLRVEPELRQLLTKLTADLVAYQDSSYAQRFVDSLTRTVGAERLVAGDSTRLSEAVARSLHRLMAYQDEYEIARLLLRPEARTAAERVGGEGATVVWKLQLPMPRTLGGSRTLTLDSGRDRPLLALLAGAKRLRGSVVDPFGRSELRRAERSLGEEYRAAIAQALHRLDDTGFEAMVELAASAMEVTGLGSLKLRSIAEFRHRLSREIAVPAG